MCRDVPVNRRRFDFWSYKDSTKEGSNISVEIGLIEVKWSFPWASSPLSPPPRSALALKENYSNRPRCPSHLFYSFKCYRYVRVILCDVAARGVGSFQVHYLWTSNPSLRARVWICFKKSNAPCVGERQPTLPGLSLPRQTGWNSSPAHRCRTRRPLCVPPLPLVLSKCYTKSCWLLKAL